MKSELVFAQREEETDEDDESAKRTNGRKYGDAADSSEKAHNRAEVFEEGSCERTAGRGMRSILVSDFHA